MKWKTKTELMCGWIMLVLVWNELRRVYQYAESGIWVCWSGYLMCMTILCKDIPEPEFIGHPGDNSPFQVHQLTVQKV